MTASELKISIVDDDESLRKAIKRLINAVGRNAEEFASAEEFLNSSRAPDTACLILDVWLAGMSGLELQTRLIASNSGIPIIFISSHSDEQLRTRALEKGAVAFLQKPFSEKDLLRAINSALAIHKSKSGDSRSPDQSRSRLNGEQRNA